MNNLNPNEIPHIEYAETERVDGKSTVTGKPWARAAVCTKCHKLKLQREFEYFLTAAQAEARGYARNIRVKSDNGLVCRHCRPRRRAISELTEREIYVRSMLGDIPVGDAEAHMARRKAQAKHRAAQYADGRWTREFKAVWAPVFAGLNEEASRTTITRSSHRKNPSLTKSPYQALRLAFYDAYHKALVVLRARLKQSHIGAAKRRRPWWPTWDMYFDEIVPGERVKLQALWQAIPVEGRMNLRIPTLINTATPREPEEQKRLYKSPVRKKAPFAPVPAFLVFKSGEKTRGQPVREPANTAPARPPIPDDPWDDFEPPPDRPTSVTPPAPTAPIPNDPWGDDDAQ